MTDNQKREAKYPEGGEAGVSCEINVDPETYDIQNKYFINL